MAEYAEFPPVLALAPFVECGWVRSSAADHSLRVMPDGCVDLYVTSAGAVMVSGPATVFHDHAAHSQGTMVGLRLRAGAAQAVTGHPVGELRDNQIPVDSAFGVSTSQLTQEVFAKTDARQRVSLLQMALGRHFAQVEPVVDRPVAHAIEMLRQCSALPVCGIASTVGLSERQLRRRFAAAVGYGPKRFGRIMRFQRLLGLIHAGSEPIRWAELAIEAGYADQPHMINECLALAGTPPTALPGATKRAETEPSVSSNTGGSAPS
jgi:transcriptional regulator GlxA family with amidase domain